MSTPTDEEAALTCAICSALVMRVDLPRHTDWHERLVDEVVTAVQVSLEDAERS
ncbi:hypothetical protein LRP67_08140 [Nocardioides sp. cx-169]|uniref:hypothetical protein n=1 Tax=Nocardioides sp. cx-169 TaxID=2899080 RepID=UPI001E5024EF|nr:hypothetical protein [Nocardioides sp. cx-169]MCD4534045.1 hypothetical protein [Nocardioides sp. cx-169]